VQIGAVVAAATNLAFALELYLKSLLAHLGESSRGHNLHSLYVALPSDAQAEIRRRHDATWRAEWNGRRASITIAKGIPEPPRWDKYSNEPKDLVAVLKRCSDCFQSWRYVLEIAVMPGSLYQYHQFEYGLLHSACIAVREPLVAALDDRASGH
jgi:HEPN domain-containing protein